MENTIVHLHTHGEDSTLDGLNKVEELVSRAVEINSPALSLTDHGTMAGIADFMKACNKANIKPIPGIEAYMAHDRTLKSKSFEELREKICKQYDILSNKGEVKKKVFNDFIRKVKRDPSTFEAEAPEIIKNYLMGGSMDLFTMDESLESPELKLANFKKDVTEYIDLTSNYHFLLIAINNQGLEDLYRISSDAYINGFYSDPRTDLKFIKENDLGKNIIATSACLGGQLAKLCFQDRMDEAKEFIQECKETFHSFYLEKQATFIREQLVYNEMIDRLAIETNTPKVITTDVHFARKEDHRLHDILVAGSFNKCVLDEDRYHYAEDHYMKTYDEIYKDFPDKEAINNTVKIAEMVDVNLPKDPLLPRYIIEEGDSVEDVLKKKVWNALFKYCIENSHLDFNNYAARLEYELDVICTAGFDDYFLITEDFIAEAKREGFLIGPGRGSAAGSLVCFLLEITTLDPIEHDLLFERFLNPERAGYPDIDIDMDEECANHLFRYLQNKYGIDNVAKIGTKGTLAARAAIRFVSKSLGHSGKGNLQLEDAFAKAIPADPGISLQEAYAESDEVKKYAKEFPEWWETALALEGHVRSSGTHAAGVVISPEPLYRSLPIRIDKDGYPVTQYPMEWVEKFLVKFDLLKLNTINLIRVAMEYAGIQGKIDIDKIDLNDPKIYKEVYQTGLLDGIFQVESTGMRGVIKDMQPTNFEDIVAILSLYRPGPMDFIPTYINRKHNLEKTTYPAPELEEVLSKTFGVWVYQEQIMEASRVIGGFTLGQADMIRKAVGKKIDSLMQRWLGIMIYGDEEYKRKHIELAKQYPKKDNIPLDEHGKPSIIIDYDLDELEDVQVEGGINRGFDEQMLLRMKKDWISFGSYAFNRSHSACYAKISLQTAYLKAYYPTEFMAALLSISSDKKDENSNPKSLQYMRECELMDIAILPPDINESDADWTPKIVDGNKQIRYGLGSISNVTFDTFKELNKHKPYTSFEDFMSKIDRRVVNKTKVLNLIKSGAFDSFNSNRNALIIQYLTEREEDVSTISDKTSKKDIIKYERETLGISVSIKSRWETIEDGKKNIQFTGYIRELDSFISKKNQEHGKIKLETNEDMIDGLIFNSNWMPLKNQLIIGSKVTIKGNRSGDKLLVNSVKESS